MTPVKLTSIGIGNDIEFSFDNLKEIYPVKSADMIKQYIGYAFFGNEALYNGKIKFEFRHGLDIYIIDRDFEKNLITLSLNGELISQELIEIKLSELFKLSEGQWDKCAIASKHYYYDGAMKNVSEFTEGIFSELKISEENAQKSSKEYCNNIQSIQNKLEILESLRQGKNNDKVFLNELDKEITAMKSDIIRLGEIVGMGRLGKSTMLKLEEAKELLAREEAKTTRIETDKKRLARSKAIEEHFSVIKEAGEAEGEAEEIQRAIEEKKESLTILQAEQNAGIKVLNKKKDEFAQASIKVKALNEAFDELISENKQTGKSDEFILSKISEFCKLGDEKASELSKEHAQLIEERKILVGKLANMGKEQEDIRKTAEYKKAVRNGACLEIAIAEKKNALSQEKKSIELDEKEVERLKEEYATNEAILAVCKRDLANTFGLGSTHRTQATLISDLNELEHIKQSLYRNQILSANLLKEINAIDKKIGENTDMIKTYTEQKKAIENAKQTLLTYVDKCTFSLEKNIAELEKIHAEKLFYEGIESLAYGSKCPICSAPISDKLDGEKALISLSEKENRTVEEKERLEGIKAEYSEKLKLIDEKIESFKSTILFATNYLNSLNETKNAKLIVLKKIYEESQVKNHEELTADLEGAIKEIASFSTALSEIKELTAREKTARETLEKIKTRLNALQGNILSEKRKNAERLASEITNYEKEYSHILEILERKQALDLSDELFKTEDREDIILGLLKEGNAKKEQLDKTIEKIEQEIVFYGERKYTFEKDGKELDYTQLCLLITAEQYNEVINEIRTCEIKRQKMQDEVVAINRLLKDKQEVIDKQKKELMDLECIYKVKVDYAHTIKEGESYEARLLENSNYATVKGEVLEDKAKESIEEEIFAYEQAILKYNSDINALTITVAEAKEAYEALDSNIMVLQELTTILGDKEKEYNSLFNKIKIDEIVEGNILLLSEQKTELLKRNADLNDISDGRGSDLVVTKTNNALSNLMPNLRVKPKGEGLVVTSTDRMGIVKELDRVDDEEYIVISVCLIYALKQLVEETLNSSDTLRIIKIRSNLLKEETKTKLKQFGKNNGLIMVFHR